MEEEEVKLNKYERYKLRMSPYDFFPQIESLDFENIGDADRYYLQDFGIFNADFSEEAFTLRARVPGGRINTEQFSNLADIVRKYDLRIIITARAGLQIHGLEAENILEVFHQVNALGLSTWQSFGDNARNIVTDIYDGVGIYAEIESYPIIIQMQERVLKNPRYVGMLPRRISVGISGNSANVVSLFANDLYFALAKKDALFGFNVYMGGKNSKVAQDANIFLHPNEVAGFFEAFIEAFFLHGLRGSRSNTRLYHLLKSIGIEQFKKYIEIEYKKPFKNAGELLLQKATFSQTQQLRDGTYSYCYQTDFARISAQEMSMLAEYATKHNASIRLGIDQNIYLFGLQEIPTALTPPRESAMIVACAGSEYCPYSYWNIKNETSYLPLEKINEHKIEVGFSGCTKGCARHQHADIGLIGLRTSSFGAAEGGAKLFLGAQHTEGKSVARAIFSMVPLQHLHALLSLIITLYEQSGYKDFEAYTANVLNKYSEDFLALWFLLNLQTGQSIQLIARTESSFAYEKSLLGVHFLGLEVLSFNTESFKKAISLTSKKLWTI